MIYRNILALALASTIITPAFAQVGDGVPDLYWCGWDWAWFTSEGLVSRPGGTLVLDSDGADIVAVLVGGPDATAGPDNGDFLVGSTLQLPDPAAPPFFISTWTSGYIGGVSQWIRTGPLDTEGFVGVIGEYDDEINTPLFPDLGVGFYPESGFYPIFENDGIYYPAILSTNNSGTFYVDIIQCLPEPSTRIPLFAGAMLLATGIRKQGCKH